MRVLIIDDNKFIRTVLKFKLSQENIITGLAESGEVGLEKVKSLKPDLILLDIILPGKNGFEILKKLKSDPDLKKIPVFVFSALNQPNDIEEAMKLGAMKYLPKTEYSAEQIIDEIKKFFLERNLIHETNQ